MDILTDLPTLSAELIDVGLHNFVSTWSHETFHRAWRLSEGVAAICYCEWNCAASGIRLCACVNKLFIHLIKNRKSAHLSVFMFKKQTKNVFYMFFYILWFSPYLFILLLLHNCTHCCLFAFSVNCEHLGGTLEHMFWCLKDCLLTTRSQVWMYS